MKLSQPIKVNFKIFSLIALVLFVYSCEHKELYGSLSIKKVNFIETYSNKILDLPDGSYVLDNPDFDINNSETWTGNMAQYVKCNYMYSVNYQVLNSGDGIAYDTEIDLYYKYNNGDEEVETIYIGEISPNRTMNGSVNVWSTNKQLVDCSAEVFWFD